MKINISKIPNIKLEEGYHLVSVSSVKDGILKGITFFECTFENENGFINRRFFLAEFGLNHLIQLLKALAVDFKRDEIDTDEFLKKKLIIRIGKKAFCKSSKHKIFFKNDILEFWHINDYHSRMDCEDYSHFEDNDYNYNKESYDWDFYRGDVDDYQYGGLSGEEAVTCWLNTN